MHWIWGMKIGKGKGDELFLLSRLLQEVCITGEQREKVRSGFGSQLHPYILNKTWFFRCDRILKQTI